MFHAEFKAYQIGHIPCLVLFLILFTISCSGGGSPTTPAPPGPTTPVFVGSVPTICSEDVVVLGDIAYVADGPGGVAIVDVSDKANPAIIGRIPTTYAIRLYIYQNYLYVCDGPDGFKVYSLGDPLNPQLIFSEDTVWATSAAFYGGYMYLGDYFGGLRVYDVSKPGQPESSGANPASRVRDVNHEGNYLMVSDAPFGIVPYNIDSPTVPICLWTDVSRMGNFEDVVGYNNYAVIARNDEVSAIAVLYIQGELTPVPKGEYYVKRFIESIARSGDILLISCGDDGFVACKLSSLPNYNKLFEVDTPGYARRAKIYGDYIYVADMDGLCVYSNPMSLSANSVRTANVETGYERSGQGSDPHPEFFNLRNLFGDIHCHTNFSDGDEPPDFAYRYARDVSKLDFCCLTDHDNHFANDNWVAEDYYREVQLKYDDPGVFSVLFGWEWTSLAGGHRLVISPENTLPVLPYIWPEFDTIDEVWAGLSGYNYITIPHYPMMHTSDWDNHYNPDYERAIEFYSKHGCFEDLVVRGIGFLGRKYSVVAASDTHQSRPGSYLKECRQDDWFWSPRSALTGVWAAENTREDIFNAIRDGHCYAIMGKRIEVQFSVNGNIMGSTIQASAPPEISFLVRSDDELIKTVQVARIDQSGLTVLQSYSPNSLEFDGTYIDNSFSGDTVYNLVVYQANDDLAFTTPVWVEMN
jgi:hypothetical protein